MGGGGAGLGWAGKPAGITPGIGIALSGPRLDLENISASFILLDWERPAARLSISWKVAMTLESSSSLSPGTY